MRETVCLLLLSVFSVCPNFTESSLPLSTAEPVASGTQAPTAWAPDCRIQTC